MCVEWQPPREFQLFPCATSRAIDYNSTGSVSNTPEHWAVEKRGDQESQEGDASRMSTTNGGSETSSQPSDNNASVKEDDQPPSAKRSRNSMTRYDINSATSSSSYISVFILSIQYWYSNCAYGLFSGLHILDNPRWIVEVFEYFIILGLKTSLNSILCAANIVRLSSFGD